jgi:ribosome biogenesis GTPase
LDLEKLGWDKHFQIQMDELDLEDIFPGRVFRIVPSGHCEVYTINGELTARVPGRLKNQVETGVELPAVGDWVLIKHLDIGNMIFKVLTRKNWVSRKVAGKEIKEQLIAANIDIMFLVMGLDNDFNLRRLERFIFMVNASRSIPVVVLNKSDLVSDMDEKENKVREVVGKNVDVHTISALTQDGVNKIRQYLKTGVTISLLGSSGVGKSTLINALIGESKQKIAEVRKKDGKGRHITKSRELFLIPGGGVMIDNPGIRELQLWGDPQGLQNIFQDIEGLSSGCKYKDCAHLNEPNCAVIAAIKSGELSQKRYDNFQKMRKELVHLSKRAEMSAEAVERAKWKAVKKGSKHYFKYKKNRD